MLKLRTSNKVSRAFLQLEKWRISSFGSPTTDPGAAEPWFCRVQNPAKTMSKPIHFASKHLNLLISSIDQCTGMRGIESDPVDWLEKRLRSPLELVRVCWSRRMGTRRTGSPPHAPPSYDARQMDPHPPPGQKLDLTDATRLPGLRIIDIQSWLLIGRCSVQILD